MQGLILVTLGEFKCNKQYTKFHVGHKRRNNLGAFDSGRGIRRFSAKPCGHKALIQYDCEHQRFSTREQKTSSIWPQQVQRCGRNAFRLGPDSSFSILIKIYYFDVIQQYFNFPIYMALFFHCKLTVILRDLIKQDLLSTCS